jgi:hypothetical protein
VYPLARRLARLRIPGNDDLVIEGLNENLILVTLLKNIAELLSIG